MRILYAGIDIDAPVAVVWQALTDYEGLGNFIPGKQSPLFAIKNMMDLKCGHFLSFFLVWTTMPLLIDRMINPHLQITTSSLEE